MSPASPAQNAWRLAVDIGGTFTDLVALDESSGAIKSLKVSSTPRDPSRAVITAVRRARDELGVDLARVSQFTHASTVASNTILEAKGARTGLITTEGFRDVLAIQRHKRYRLFDMAYQKVKPLVPARWIHGVKERMDSEGNVQVPLDEEATVRAMLALKAEGIDALAVCFLFSFRNAAHEQRVAEIAKDVLPGIFVTCSADILPHAMVPATNIGRVRHYLRLLTAERENEQEDPTTCLPLGGAAGHYEGVFKTQPISLPPESSRLRRGYGRWYKCTWRCTSDPVQEEPHYESTDSDSKTREHNSHQAVMVEPPALQEGCWNHAGPP